MSWPRWLIPAFRRRRVHILFTVFNPNQLQVSVFVFVYSYYHYYPWLKRRTGHLHIQNVQNSRRCIFSKGAIFYRNIDASFHSFIHSVVCLTTGPKPPPKRFLHIVRPRASSFKWKYPFPSLRSSSSFLRLLPRLLATSISPFIFPSITCFRRQFLRKMWPSQLAFRFLISCRIFLCSLTLSNSSSFLTWTKNYYWFLEDTQKYLCLPKKFHLSHFLILFVSHDTNSFCKPCA